MRENDYPPPLPIDERIQSPQMKAVKALIPFMEPAAGKRAAVMVKLLEMSNIIALFDEEISARAASGESRDGWLDESGIISAIRPYCDEEMSKMADMVERALEMRKMAELMFFMNGGGTTRKGD